MRRIAQSLVMLAVLSMLAACSSSSAQSPTISADVNANANSVLSFDGLPVDGAKVPLVAKVNGAEITLPEFQQAYTRTQQDTDAADPVALAGSVLDTLIEQQLIDQAAASMNITLSDADLNKELQTYVDQAGSQQAWQQWLTQNQFTTDQFRDNLRQTLITQRVRDAVTQDVNGALHQVHARHILLRTEDDAKLILARLQAGEDFAALAQQYSHDVTSSQQGGDLGWFTKDELLEPSLAEVAFSLKPGQIAGPIVTRLGYHVIQTLEFADRPVDPAKRAALAQAEFETWLQSLLDKATVEKYLKNGG